VPTKPTKDMVNSMIQLFTIQWIKDFYVFTLHFVNTFSPGMRNFLITKFCTKQFWEFEINCFNMFLGLFSKCNKVLHRANVQKNQQKKRLFTRTLHALQDSIHNNMKQWNIKIVLNSILKNEFYRGWFGARVPSGENEP
jgi:hypothetical protein